MVSMRLTLFFCLINISTSVASQPTISKVWVSDNGDGTYKNPIINADYSDPDAIRVGDDFYLVSSSFEDVPGLPILHSKDLVNWTIIAHALKRQPPYEHFNKPQHGNGVWAPVIRYHNNEFYIYYPDPDFGIYLVKSKNITGPWSEPLLIYPGKGIIDPCPLWDDDGNVYLVHGFAGSRAGIKSVIAVNKMNSDGTKVIDDGAIVYDGHDQDPTLEGPKIYKRNGYYYIMAPAGGVPTGWQLVLRSKNIYGPYERKVVMDQGNTIINGPHQGAWVTTQKGEHWFLHFQDKGVYGRVLHLQPMIWKNDWPVIGIDKDGDGKGQPVLTYKKPNVGKTYSIQTPVESDEFNTNILGLQWQWMANPTSFYAFMNTANGSLRLYAYNIDSAKNLWQKPNVLLQKLPAGECMFTTRLSFKPNNRNAEETTGLVMMGMSYAGIVLQSQHDSIFIKRVVCIGAEEGNAETVINIDKVKQSDIYFRITMYKGGLCSFGYSYDGKSFTKAGDDFQAVQGRWIGAKVGLFSTGSQKSNDCGYADVDWFRVEPLTKKAE
jgi:beta-xylosidase